LAAFFFAGAFFLALLVALFLMAIATSSWASDQEAAACGLSTLPGENPQPPVHRIHTAWSIEVHGCKSQETTAVLGKFF
jgi:invasion protein IalB